MFILLAARPNSKDISLETIESDENINSNECNDYGSNEINDNDYLSDIFDQREKTKGQKSGGKKRKRSDFEDDDLKEDNEMLDKARSESIVEVVKKNRETFGKKNKKVDKVSKIDEEEEKQRLQYSQNIIDTLDILQASFLQYEKNGKVDIFQWWNNRDGKFLTEHFRTKGIGDQDQLPILLEIMPTYYNRRESGMYIEIIAQLKARNELPQHWIDFYAVNKEMSDDNNKNNINLDDDSNIESSVSTSPHSQMRSMYPKLNGMDVDKETENVNDSDNDDVTV